MVFGYIFPVLDDEQKHRRRQLLDQWASVAQLSAVVVIASIQLNFLVALVARKRWAAALSDVPSSPVLKDERRRGQTAGWMRSARRWHVRFSWWAGEEVAAGWGTKGVWLGAALWTGWLGFCAVFQTGNDYMHLTKRFGIIGASQLPLHYLLAIRTPYSPLQFLTRSSHEQLKEVHQVLGRIITFFFALHALFYLNAFAQMGGFWEKLTHRVVILGLLSIVMFSLIGTTALDWVRTRSYRTFYAVHVVLAAAVLPLLYFHVHHIRPFIWQTLAVFVLNGLLRFFNSFVLDGSISRIPHTNLIRVNMHLPPKKAGLFKYPGQHVYLQIPSTESMGAATLKQSKELLGLRSNPFTVVSLPELDNSLVLIARAMKGNTKDLAGLRHSMSQGHSNRSVGLRVEGPYGASSWLPDLQSFDSILLVAGGVGATFIVPIWRRICMLSSADGRNVADRVRFVWAVRNQTEIVWAFPSPGASSVLSHGTARVEVYTTRSNADDEGEDTSASGKAYHKSQHGDGDEVEMSEGARLLSSDGSSQGSAGIKIIPGRPKLSHIVDDAFAVPGARVAVLACGPQSMTSELRKDVGRWVKKGRDVYWHAEAFGL